MKERRKFIRVPRKGLIRFREMNLPKKSPASNESIYQNISAGGILFESSRPLAAGMVLSLEIELRDWSRYLKEGVAAQFENLPLKLLGEVVRCEELIAGSVYQVGVKFVGIDEKYQRALLHYIEESVKQQ